MLCEKCGRVINNDENFCSECGAEVVRNERSQTQSDQMDNVQDNGSSVQSPDSQNNLPSAGEAVAFCCFCGAALDSDAVVCPNCGERCGDVPTKKSSKFLKKFMKKSVIIAAAAIAIVVVFGNIYPYAKNAIMKLVLPSDKYFAYVVGSNVSDLADTVSSNLSTSKDYALKGYGVEGDVSLKSGEGLETLLSDLDVRLPDEYVEWFESAAVSFKINSKDNMTDINLDTKLNGVNFGEIDTVTDIDDSAFYFALPDYNKEYIGGEVNSSAGMTSEEANEQLRQIMEALPKKKVTKKLITKYVKTVVTSVEDVEEETETITADGVSQKVTMLSFDIDGELAKNVATNVLTELKDDDEIHKIVDEISDVAEVDSDELWDALDDTLEELEDIDGEDLAPNLGTFSLYVNAKGEIVGFTLETDDGEINAYVAEKGNKFGVLFEIDSMQKVILEGGGKISGNKKSGEFELEVMGFELLNFEVKKLDTKKLKKGIYNGSITIRCSDGIDVLKYTVDRDLIELIADLTLTIESSSKSTEDCDYTISVAYQDETCAELDMTAKVKKAKKVKEPKDYVDLNDSDAEEWLEEFDFDKLLDKLRDANAPDDLVDELEDYFEYFS